MRGNLQKQLILYIRNEICMYTLTNNDESWDKKIEKKNFFCINKYFFEAKYGSQNNRKILSNGGFLNTAFSLEV